MSISSIRSFNMCSFPRRGVVRWVCLCLTLGNGHGTYTTKKKEKTIKGWLFFIHSHHMWKRFSFFKKILSTWLVYWRWGIWFLFGLESVSLFILFILLHDLHTQSLYLFGVVYISDLDILVLYTACLYAWCLSGWTEKEKGKGVSGVHVHHFSYLFCSGPVWCDTLVWDWVKRIVISIRSFYSLRFVG